jgi:hypothetical protein
MVVWVWIAGAIEARGNKREGQQSEVGHQVSGISNQQSAISNQQSAICGPRRSTLDFVSRPFHGKFLLSCPFSAATKLLGTHLKVNRVIQNRK